MSEADASHDDSKDSVRSGTFAVYEPEVGQRRILQCLSPSFQPDYLGRPACRCGRRFRSACHASMQIVSG
jgi:hypothetical protein